MAGLSEVDRGRRMAMLAGMREQETQARVATITRAQKYVAEGLELRDVCSALRISRATWFRWLREVREATWQ